MNNIKAIIIIDLISGSWSENNAGSKKMNKNDKEVLKTCLSNRKNMMIDVFTAHRINKW